MFIDGIYVLGTLLPIGDVNYGIARVANVSGQLPEVLADSSYSTIGRDVPHASMRPSEFNFQDSTCEELPAFYVIVREVEVDNDGNSVFKIVESIDEFLVPFDFPDDIKKDFERYYLDDRSNAASLETFQYTLEDEDSGTSVQAFGWLNKLETQYVGLCKEDESINEVSQVLTAQQISQIKSDNMIKILFGEMLDKGVDIYNGLHYKNKADEIADIISKITYINESGVKGPLNFTAIEKLFSNIKDRLLVGSSAAKPVVRRNED